MPERPWSDFKEVEAGAVLAEQQKCGSRHDVASIRSQVQEALAPIAKMIRGKLNPLRLCEHRLRFRLCQSRIATHPSQRLLQQDELVIVGLALEPY